MIYELQEHEYERVRQLFDGLSYHLVIYSIIEGNSPGVVYVDNTDNPRTAFIWDKIEGGFYLAGYEGDQEFNESLNEWIIGRVYPAAKKLLHVVEFALYYFPETWEDQIDVVLKNTSPMKHYRKHFYLKQLRVDWRSQIPDGFVMTRVDERLLKKTELKNIDQVTQWVETSWGSVENFREKGFGFCVVHGNDIVSWSIADYVAGKERREYEIGIHTDENYRRRGFATITAAAAVDFCISNGVERIGWHCWSPNLGSAATARKVGFEQTIEHPIYHAWYNAFDNLIVQGHLSLERQNFRESAECYEKAFRMKESGEAETLDSRIFFNDESGSRCYYDAARAWARAGESGNAIRNLKKAMDSGWADMERMRNDADLVSLHEEEGWKGLCRPK